MMKYLILVISLSLLSVVANAKTKTEKALPVSLAEVKLYSKQQLSWFNATVISSQNIKISAENTGKITWIAEFGKLIKKGELLATIDDKTLKLKLKYQQQLLRRAKENRQYRVQELKRLESMKKVQGISQTQVDLASHEYQIANIELEEQKINIETIRQDIAKSLTYAPFNGVVEVQHLQTGEYAETGQALITLVNKAAAEIRLFAPIALVNTLTASQNLHVKQGEKKGMATLTARSYSADEKSRQLELRLKPENPAEWHIGQALQVALPKSMNKNALSIPRDALVVDKLGRAIFKMDKSNQVTRIPVQVVSGNEDTIAILGEVKAGDQVVVKGSGMLKTGDKVNPI